MKGVALSLCRFFSSLSTAHVRGAAPLFSSASHFSIEDEELSFLPTVLSSLQELASFFFGFFYFPRLKKELVAVLCRLHCRYSDRLTHSHRQRNKEKNSSSASRG